MEEAAALRGSGVRRLDAREVAMMGYPDLPVNTLIDFRRKAVSAANIREMNAPGAKRLQGVGK